MHASPKQYQFEFQSFRQNLKSTVGEALAPLLPARVERLTAEPNRKAASFVDRLLMQGLVRSKSRVGDHEFLARLHRAEWERELCKDFCENTAYRFQNWFLKQHVAAVDALERELAESGNVFRNLVEVGCGAGQVTHYMAARFSGLESVTGIDICPQQIARNNDVNEDDRINFLAYDGLRWVCENSGPDSIFMTNGGVLEYFAPSELDEVFSHLKANAPALVLTIEPIAVDHDLKTQLESRPFGEERSLSHNYPEILRRNGFQTVFQEECFVDEYRFVMLVSKS